MTEYEINAQIQYEALMRNADKMAFDTIVASGQRTAFPHGRPTKRKIKNGDAIMIDFGIQLDGYQSDMTRMIFMGTPNKKWLNFYNIVVEAQQAAINEVKVGMKASELDNIARKVISFYGLEEYFVHGLGHGIGVDNSTELPVLNQTSDLIIENKMVFTCEPGIYFPQFGGVRIEDIVLMDNNQGQSLTTTTKDIITL